MTFRFVDHTSELGIAIEAETEEGVFADALAAFADLVSSGEAGEPERHELVLTADDRAALLVAWLEELIFLGDARGFVPEALVELQLEPGGLRAVVDGRRASPRPLVKAVTYHGLEFVHDQERVHAHVVLDV